MIEATTISLKCDALLCLGCRVPGIPPQERVLVLEDPWSHPEPARLRDWLRKHAARHGSRGQVVTSRVGDPSREAPAWVKATISAHLQQTGMGHATAQRFTAAWTHNFLRTLQRRPRWATTAREPWAGRPVFIVGAGSSLDRNGHLLREAQHRGPVVALNSSAGCCAHHGVVPDVLFCCEGIPLPEHVRPFVDGERTQIVLDAQSSHETWAAAPSAVAVSLHQLYFTPYVLQLGAMPLHYSTSSSTGAAALALLWGASEIVLVGHDHACCNPVSDYAQGSPFYGNRARIDESDYALVYEGGGKAPYRLPCCMRQGWGGGDPVVSEHTFSPVIEWYMKLSARGIVTNATEGGADIPGTDCETLGSVIERYPVADPVVPEYEPAADTRPVLDGIAERARDVIATGATEWPAGFPLLGMWVVPALERAEVGKRAEAVAEAVQQGAREILETLEAA